MTWACARPSVRPSVRAAAVSVLAALLRWILLLLLRLVTFGADWVKGRRLGSAARA